MLFCDRNQIGIDSFCDNNMMLYGEKKIGFSVISPEELRNNIYDKNEMVLLSMKKGKEQVRKQLVDLGISSDRVIDEIPEEVMRDI